MLFRFDGYFVYTTVSAENAISHNYVVQDRIFRAIPQSTENSVLIPS